MHADEAFLSGEAKTADTDGTVHFDSLESMVLGQKKVLDVQNTTK